MALEPWARDRIEHQKKMGEFAPARGMFAESIAIILIVVFYIGMAILGCVLMYWVGRAILGA
jgi:uncharacterized membrane protein (DUF485 family)